MSAGASDLHIRPGDARGERLFINDALAAKFPPDRVGFQQFPTVLGQLQTC